MFVFVRVARSILLLKNFLSIRKNLLVLMNQMWLQTSVFNTDSKNI